MKKKYKGQNKYIEKKTENARAIDINTLSKRISGERGLNKNVIWI